MVARIPQKQAKIVPPLNPVLLRETLTKSKRSECNSPLFRRARSRINFKVSPPKKRDFDRENNWHLANRVAPKNRPWAKKTVLFLTTPSQQHIFCKTGSPYIPRTKQIPHQFLIKSPPSAPKLKLKMKISPKASVSPARLAAHSKKSPKMSAASKLRRSFLPSKLSSPLKSRRELRKKDDDGTLRSTVHSKMSPKLSKLRRPFSPSRLATRLVSPLKRKKDDADESGRGRRPTSSLPLGISALRI